MVDLSDLVIPVYLNQRVVFDLVAVLEGGIASVTQVSHTQSEVADKASQLGVSFGLSKAFASLLRIDLTGKLDKRTSDGLSTTKTEDRIHTPASLFITLRSILRERRYLKTVGQGIDIIPGDLVEFSTALKRNPLTETLDSFMEIMDIFGSFEEKSDKKRNHKVDQWKTLKKQLTPLIESLKGGDTVDLTTPPLSSGHRAVISIEKHHLNDPTMSDLVDGTFWVVGKVTRSIGQSEGSISLNRKSAFSRLPSSVLETFKEALQATEKSGIKTPVLEWEIEGPAIQVLPIAIFA
jgi:hypothetical protein